MNITENFQAEWKAYFDKLFAKKKGAKVDAVKTKPEEKLPAGQKLVRPLNHDFNRRRDC
jgi:hypothetical protein